jgi:hypothetical protein
MRKPKTNTWYKKKSIEMAKKLAVLRDNEQCQRCGAKRGEYQIHASHILSVGAHPCLAADVDNIKALCARHHSAMFKGSWHEDPKGQGWFDKKYPGRVKALLERERKREGKTDWKNKYEQLKQHMNDL